MIISDSLPSRCSLGQALGEIMAKFFVNPTLLRVVRVARVGRVLRLVKGLWMRNGIHSLTARLFSRSEGYSNTALRLGGVHAGTLQYRSFTFSGHVHLFDLRHVLLRLCSKIGGCDGSVQLRNIPQFDHHSLSNVY